MCVDRLRPLHWWNLESGLLVNSELSVPEMSLKHLYVSIFTSRPLSHFICQAIHCDAGPLNLPPPLDPEHAPSH